MKAFSEGINSFKRSDLQQSNKALAFFSDLFALLHTGFAAILLIHHLNYHHMTSKIKSNWTSVCERCGCMFVHYSVNK